MSILVYVACAMTNGYTLKECFSFKDITRIYATRTKFNRLMNKFYEQHGVMDTLLLATPERKVLRAQLIEQVHQRGQEHRKHERHFYFILGLPGAGKSTWVEELAPQHDALVVDADDFKLLLPEYQQFGGIAAGLVHRESSALVEELLAQAIEQGENIIYPTVGSWLDAIELLCEVLRENNYTIHVYLVDIPVLEAARRVWHRFLKSGRFVDPELVFKAGLQPKWNYDKIVEEDIVYETCCKNAEI